MAKIYEFGMAPQAKLAGYEVLVKTVISTDAQLLKNHAEEDVAFVRGAAIYGRPGVFEFARIERRAYVETKVKARTVAIGDQSMEESEKPVEELAVGDLVDLTSCPYLKDHSTAGLIYAEVAHTERETQDCVVIGYEDIDHVGYPVGTMLTVVKERAVPTTAG